MNGKNKTAEAKSSKAKANVPGVDFGSLRQGMCKFPLGGIDDAPDRFCGAGALEGSPYCQDCAKKAYNKPERRR